MNRVQDVRRNDAIILQRLAAGPATTGELAKAIYGEAGYHARRSLWVAIHRLRQRGVRIATVGEANGQSDAQRYRLVNATDCPYCNGSGVIAVEGQ